MWRNHKLLFVPEIKAAMSNDHSFLETWQETDTLPRVSHNNHGLEYMLC